MQHHVARISGRFDNIAHIAECKPVLPQLSSDMLIIEIDGRLVHERPTGMEEKLFDKEYERVVTICNEYRKCANG